LPKPAFPRVYHHRSSDAAFQWLKPQQLAAEWGLFFVLVSPPGANQFLPVIPPHGEGLMGSRSSPPQRPRLERRTPLECHTTGFPYLWRGICDNLNPRKSVPTLFTFSLTREFEGAKCPRQTAFWDPHSFRALLTGKFLRIQSTFGFRSSGSSLFITIDFGGGGAGGIFSCFVRLRFVLFF